MNVVARLDCKNIDERVLIELKKYTLMKYGTLRAMSKALNDILYDYFFILKKGQHNTATYEGVLQPSRKINAVTKRKIELLKSLLLNEILYEDILEDLIMHLGITSHTSIRDYKKFLISSGFITYVKTVERYGKKVNVFKVNTLKVRSFLREHNVDLSEFEDLESSLNSLKLFPKTIKFKEKEQIDKKEKEIREIEEKTYSREEIKGMIPELERDVYSRKLEGLYEKYRDCLVFDAKMVQIANIRRNMKDFIVKCNEKLSKLKEKLGNLIDLKSSIEGHEILTTTYPCDDFPFSCNLQNWVKRNLKNIIGGK